MPWGRRPTRWFIVAVASVFLLAVSAPAQQPGETAAILVQSSYTLIRENALTPPTGQTMLRPAIAAIQQALAGVSGGGWPEAPALGGSDQEDLQAVAGYLRAAVQSYAPHSAESLIAATLRAMTRTVGDAQGAVFTPSEYTHLLEGIRGEADGIGLQVDLVDGLIVVAELTPGGPALRAGVRLSDVLREINGLSLEDRTPDQVIQLLRGGVGSQVSLTIQRGSGLLRFTILRDRVREIPVRAQMLGEKVGYLRLLEFTEDAHIDVRRGLGKLTAQGAQAVVLDLRENGGGLVDEAVLIASIFLPRGIVATEEGRGAPVSLLVRPTDVRFAGPMVVLVNGFTASASEIVAGALQDVGVSLVGERTYGKGTIQTLFPLPADWALRLTTARYRTRNGRPLEGVGLAPDFVVATPAQWIQGPRDMQLTTARFLVTRKLSGVGRP